MATGTAVGSFTLDLDELGWTGQDLQRPESVVAEPDGTLWACDGRGGVPASTPTAARHCWAAWGGEPDGLAVDPTATWSPQHRPWRVQRTTRDGQVATVLERSTASPPPAPTSCSTTAPGGCGWPA